MVCLLQFLTSYIIGKVKSPQASRRSKNPRACLDPFESLGFALKCQLNIAPTLEAAEQIFAAGAEIIDTADGADYFGGYLFDLQLMAGTPQFRAHVYFVDATREQKPHAPFGSTALLRAVVVLGHFHITIRTKGCNNNRFRPTEFRDETEELRVASPKCVDEEEPRFIVDDHL